MKNFIITAAILLTSVIGFAQQDTIVKKTNEKIPCYIVKVDDANELIVYRVIDEVNSPQLSMVYSRVRKIVFRNGQSLIIENLDEVVETESFINMRKNAIKANMIKPLFNSFELSYERSVQPSINIQGTVGIVTEAMNVGEIGEQRTAEKGVYFKFQTKFFTKSVKSGDRSHPLAGAYIAPEIILTAYNYNQNAYLYNYQTGASTVSSENFSNAAGAFMLNFGKQWVLADVLLVELFGGLGLDFGESDYRDTRRYSHINAGGLAMDFGVRLGVAL
ncbi:MAG: hypothetical protein ACI9J3_002837 [Parvicellaceae bacterium]|jgi:hypothetical protein